MKIVDHLYNTLRIDIANYRVRFCNLFFNLLDLLIIGLYCVLCKNKRMCLVAMTVGSNQLVIFPPSLCPDCNILCSFKLLACTQC